MIGYRIIFSLCMIFAVSQSPAQSLNNLHFRDSSKAGHRSSLYFPPSLRFLPASQLSGPSFFCRQEYKLETATGLPFRFRLGSLDYCNYLEQKPNALKPLYW
ncbi:MAG: hypothetical protein ABIT96_04330 [Ferruginibacter sp.]